MRLLVLGKENARYIRPITSQHKPYQMQETLVFKFVRFKSGRFQRVRNFIYYTEEKRRVADLYERKTAMKNKTWWAKQYDACHDAVTAPAVCQWRRRLLVSACVLVDAECVQHRF